MSAHPFKRGVVFRHPSILDPDFKPGPGQRYSDAPKALCRVTRTVGNEVYYGIGADARRASYVVSGEQLLVRGAEVIATNT